MKWILIPAVALAACSGGDANRDTVSQQSASMAADTTMAAAPDTMANRPAATAMNDTSIVTELAQADMAEVQQAKAALTQTKSPAVRTLALRLQADHSAHLKQLRTLATKLHVTMPDSSTTPSAPDLQGKTGAAFDSAFVQHAIDDHQKDIDKLQNTMLPAAQSADLKSLIRATVPKLQSHLALAQTTERKLGS
jgi:putative membrane protein